MSVTPGQAGLWSIRDILPVLASGYARAASCPMTAACISQPSPMPVI
jgi:hypothetical protein